MTNSSDVVVAYHDTTLGIPFDNSGDTEVQISISGNTADIENLIETYSVRVYGATDLNRIEIKNDSDATKGSTANKTFDVGAIEVGSAAADTDQVTMNFEDDGPTITNGAAIPDLTVDESALATDDSKDFSVIFNTSYGQDTLARSATRW